MNRSILLILASLFLAGLPARSAPADLIKEARAKASANDPNGAIAVYREVVAQPEADLKTKIQACNAIADVYVNVLYKYDEGLAAIDALIALEGLSETDKLTARNRKASTLMRIRTRARAVEMRMIWADIGRDTRLTPAQRSQGWIAVANNAAESSVYANLGEAREALAQALAIEGLNESERANVYAQGILFSLKVKEYPAATDYAQRIIAAPAATAAQKLNAHYQLAGIQLMQGDEAAADKTARQALALPQLTSAEQAVAQVNIGKLNARMYRHAAAREAYADAIKLDPLQAYKAGFAIADSWVAEGNYEAAFKLHHDAGRFADAAKVRQVQGDAEAALKLCRSTIDNPALDEDQRWNAMLRYIEICNEGSRFADVQSVLVQFEALADATPARYAALLPILRIAMTRAAYPFAKVVSTTLCRTSALRVEDHYQSRLYRVNALVGAGDLPKAVSCADDFAQDPLLAPERRLFFALVQALLSGADEQAVTQKMIATVMNAFAQAEITPAQKQDALLRAGRTAMIAQRYETAKAVGASYDALFVPEPVKTYTVAFMPKASSIDSFLTSNVVKNAAQRGVFDRKFGGNLELVAATDVSTGDRGDIGITAGAKGDTETYFHAVCNDDGIHIFLDARDDQAAEVAAGLLRGGSFEGYIAAGEREPHTCFLANLQTGKVTLWNSAYASELHRPVKTDQSNFRTEFRHTPDSHLLYLFFGWDLFFDRLPEGDDFWLFEVGRWARSGRVTWNGLKTVHGRSSFGHWRFDMRDADRLAIKRKLVYKALASYTEEKNPRTGGAVDFYADKDYSDPAFYAAEVAPLVKQLDDYGKLVTATMTDAEVDRLYTRAVPDWMNVRYRIAALRRAYLERKLTAE